MLVADRKDALRRRLRTRRDMLDGPERAAIDARICDRLFGDGAMAHARVLLCYLAIGSEVETRGIICAAWNAGKCVALPRCVPGTRELRWYRITSFDGLVRGPLGVDEPAGDAAAEQDVHVCGALALVPGLAFDRQGYRLGYGSGYYDAFLSDFRGLSVGLARESQLCGSLASLGATEAHDRRVDMLVSELRTIRCTSRGSLRA